MSEATPYPWLALLPDVIQHAAASTEHPLLDAFARWNSAAARLHLSAGESAVAAAIMAMEVDTTIHAHIMSERAGQRCSRADIVLLLRPTLAKEALASLISLERRAIATSVDECGMPWSHGGIALAASVRAFCFGTDRSREIIVSKLSVRRLDEDVAAALATVARIGARNAHIITRGRAGSGRDSLLAALLRGLGSAAYMMDPLQLRAGETLPGDTFEPALSGRVAVWDARDIASSPEDVARGAQFLARSATACVSLLDNLDDAPVVPGRTTLLINTDPASYDERLAGWRSALGRHIQPALVDSVARRLSAETRAGCGLAHRAARAVEPPADESTDVWTQALHHQLQAAVQPSDLRGVAVEHPSTNLDSLVCRPETMDLIGQLLAMMRNASRLASRSRAGAKALLSGPSGTGKTLAARCLACAAARPLYRVDLAAVVSKWIGETEKNLRAGMEAAEAVGAVLLFDEGDALFGARGEVERGSDRYANMEVSYLLQALEAYDGTVIVTTNLRTNIDRAFQRRFDFFIDFREPDAELRDALWRQELGDTSDAAENLSAELLDDIARNAEISGGHIAVAARVARALALDAGRPMNDTDVLRALSAELRKRGANVAASRWDKHLAQVTRHVKPISD